MKVTNWLSQYFPSKRTGICFVLAGVILLALVVWPKGACARGIKPKFRGKLIEDLNHMYKAVIPCPQDKHRRKRRGCHIYGHGAHTKLLKGLEKHLLLVTNLESLVKQQKKTNQELEKKVELKDKLILQEKKRSKSLGLEIVNLQKQKAKSVLRIKDLEKENAKLNSPWRHPAVWVMVGVLVTGAAIGIGYGIVEANKGNNTGMKFIEQNPGDPQVYKAVPGRPSSSLSLVLR